MKCLGVDVGEERVGIAISDNGGSIAFPLEQVEQKACIERILKLVDEWDISTVVLGESVNLDGSDNPIMKNIHEIADTLRGQIQVVFEPEQFSTQAAKRLGKGSDAEAASIILQSYLDRKNIGKKEDIMFE